MITAEYCQVMARYNAWQNNGIRDLVKAMDEEELRRDRGAFFGSIFETLNHILWADMLWLNRLGAGDPPPVPAAEHRVMTPNKAEWDRQRFLMDGRIREWALGLSSIDLTGDLTWHSAIKGADMVTPVAVCVTHMFNHQTHHRGQVHAMMTAAGQTTVDTDLPFMPE